MALTAEWEEGLAQRLAVYHFKGASLEHLVSAHVTNPEMAARVRARIEAINGSVPESIAVEMPVVEDAPERETAAEASDGKVDE
ncbi:MAG TPA: hypothetical protein VHI13_08820 [Candidatus Kapabacteria bacterium]|nr:hypothetical protein [Candidatus Kapabacteria bacterium]